MKSVSNLQILFKHSFLLYFLGELLMSATMFSFTLQKVLASRKELLEYDCRESKGPLETAASSGSLLLSAGVKGLQGECYGCASAAIEHCVTLLKALAMLPATRKQLVEEVRHYAVCYNVIRMFRTTVTCTIFF